MAGMEELAIYSFPVLAYVLFSALRLVHAIPITVLTGFLLLPPAYALPVPLLPTIEKNNVIALTVAALAAIFAPRGPPRALAHRFEPTAEPETLPGILPREQWARICVALLLVGPVGTLATNLDPVMVHGEWRPGLTLYDVGNEIQTALVFLLPILVARKFLAGEYGQRVVLVSLAVAGLAYSLPTLVEVRLSPQLHNWIYGGFQHSWIQHLRGDGYRPVVFMTHGLVLGLFLCTALLATVGCARAFSGWRRWAFLAAFVYLAAVLVVSKTLGALMIALALLPAAILPRRRLQLLAAAAVAVFVVAYPAVRAMGISPFDTVVTVISDVHTDRAASLETRLEQERVLTDHGMGKPVFGWGGYARALSLPDGEAAPRSRDGLWLIIFGEQGAVGFFAFFGLLCFPVILLAARSRRHDVSMETSALAVVLAANLLDLIPNSSLTPVTLMLAGALLGRVERARQAEPAAARAGRGVRARATPAEATAREATPARPVDRAGQERPARRGAGAGRTAPAAARGEVSERYTRFPAGPPAPRRT